MATVESGAVKNRPRSYSQFRALAECNRRWWLSQKYEPKVKSSALAEGDVFHIALGKFYLQQDKSAGMTVLDEMALQYQHQAKEAGASDETQEKLFKKLSIMKTMASSYWDNIVVQDLKRLEILAIEKPFSLDVGEGLVINGVIDGIFRDVHTKTRFIFEHKYKTDHDDELLPLDLQSSVYVMSQMKEFGILPVTYNVTKKPQQRQAKKDNTVSGFLNRVATEVAEEIKGWHGYGTNDYESKYFVRRTISRGRTDLQAALDQMRGQDIVMKMIEGNPRLAARNVGEQCLYYCPFRPICIDEDPMTIENLYVQKGSRTVAPPADPSAPAPAKSTRITI